MKQYAQRGTALSLAVLLLAGSAQALFGRGKEKTEPVAPENAPAARDLEIQTYRGIPYQGRLEATAPNGDDLTYSVAAQPKKGTVMIDGADFVYTPKENALGADSFTYTAADFPAGNRNGDHRAFPLRRYLCRYGRIHCRRRAVSCGAGNLHWGKNRRELVF